MLSVKDIMQRDVVTVTTDATARYLARLLDDEEISGVPVLDAHGHLAGVVSSTDLVRLAADDTGGQLGAESARASDALQDSEGELEDGDDEPDPYGFFLPEVSPFSGAPFLEDGPQSGFDTVLVRDIMNPVSFTVEAATPLPDLCDLLVRRRIHRAVVVERGELLGIVTSVDVLRAVAQQRVA